MGPNRLRRPIKLLIKAAARKDKERPLADNGLAAKGDNRRYFMRFLGSSNI